ncbi:OmpA family protein [Oceanospirillum sediminis]|uniref:OmpA family protein n=1 Tax=Oceanospirillum sediminis TaxID=2760088 RepID=A0A839IQ17_9GAMM|nr:OmpA family protein [Oceanospirillum sediminis]MBB1487345.1 OmpA family protein [Oceanospirillum sediminis]
MTACSSVEEGYPYAPDRVLENRVADAIRIANLRIQQLNLSGGSECTPGRIYRMQQLANRIEREHLTGLDTDALHNLRVLEQQIQDTENGLRYIRSSTTCIEDRHDLRMKAIAPLLAELSDFSFIFNNHSLPADIKKPLLELINWLKKNPVYQVVLTGHADSEGTQEHNSRLALERANTIARFMHEKGIPDYQIRVNALGEFEPVASNQIPVTKAANRRVDFSLTLLINQKYRSYQIKNWPAMTELWGDE